MHIAFISERTFTQRGFAAFVAQRSARDDNRYELLRGKIVMNPPSSWPHGEAELDLGAVLRDHVKKNKLGMVAGASLGYELPGGHTVAPDASVVLQERLDAGPPREPGKFLRVVPNLVCEILSPDSERRDRVEKLEIYAEAGIDEYWTIDLSRRRIRIHHLTPDGVYDAGEEFACGQRLRSRVLPRLRCLVDPLVSYPA